MKYFTVARSAVEQEKDFGGRDVGLIVEQSVSVLLNSSGGEEQSDCSR